MKKLSLMSLVVLGALLLNNCKKETPKGNEGGTTETPKQRTVGIYFGGTWCPPCGAYGKPAKEQLKSELKDDAVIISCQVNGGTADPMNNADANAFLTGFGVTGVPTMFTGGANEVMKGVGGSTTMATTLIANAKATNALAAFANISATVTIEGSNITVNTKTKFFKDQTEEYYVSAYVLESGLNYAQSSDASVNKNIHDNVLRTKLSSSVFGDLIGSNVKTGDSKDRFFTGTINSAWKKENITVAVVLWRKNSDGKVTICNGVTVKP